MPHHHPPALQAAPGQWPGPSPGTNSPPDCSCPGSAQDRRTGARQRGGPRDVIPVNVKGGEFSFERVVH